MERQSTSKLYRALIAVVAFFVLCTSAILFASCGTNPLECEHTYGPGDVKEVRVATCGENGTVTYECSKCGALVTVTGTLATGDHTIVNGRCTKCGATGTEGNLTLADLKADLTSILTALNTVAGKADVDKVAGSVVEALKNPDTTIPNLWKLLTDIRDNIAELDFGDIEIIDNGETTTLGAVIASLYKQVNKLYVDLTDEGKNTDGLYDLLVGVGGTGTQEHVHNWVLELKDPGSYSCTNPNTYVWGCSFCDATKGDEVTVMATGHATEFVTGKTAEGHHYDATCITPERVEGYCNNCKQYTGEWTTQGQPTYQHHYVLETQRVIPGADGTCTAVHQNVYHCETCGGAYVEETKSSSQHNYYYTLNEDGTKSPMSDEDKLTVWNDAHPKAEDKLDSLDNLTYAQEQELNELLKEDHLNIVYYSEPNCVDPALIVVECMECGVRYAYTFGQPDGHHFIRVHKDVDETCTMDGVEQYFYCDHCGYFFFLKGIQEDMLEKITETGDFKDLYEFKADVNLGSQAYTRNYMTDLTGVIHNDKMGDEDTAFAETEAYKRAYDEATKKAPALGHDYEVVYTNNRKCVTAQDYILVCKRDGCLVEGKEFVKDLVQVGDETVKADALFYQAVENGPYFLKGLTGDNTKTVLDALLATVHETLDDEDSDLTKEWDALETAEDSAIAEWLEGHSYLVRDDDDDESAETLKALTGNDLKALYHGGNVIKGFELPVTGHAFNDYFVTVVGGCTLYERHVRFCAVCGQYTATPSETTGVWPYIVSGDTDASLLKGGDNDLKTSWDAVCAAADAQSDPTEGQNMLIEWLFDHGYLNDYRVRLTENDVENEADRLDWECKLVGQRLGMLLGEKLTSEWLKDQFTGKNVLDEFKVTKKFGQTDMQEDVQDPDFIPNDTDIVLGHTFNAVALLSEEVCDAPGRYVYVCSKCGDPLNTSNSTLKYMSGSATVNTGLKLVENPIFKCEEYILKASAQKARLDDQTTKDKLDKSDLQRLYEGVENVGDKKFDWLLKMGYLNNVIDTYYTVGYTDEDDVLHGGWLAQEIEKAGDNTANIESSIQTWYNTARRYFYENGALKADAVTEHKDYLKALALQLLGKDGKITDYYEKSSNTYRTDPEDPDTEVKDVPANKTIDNAATEVPMSGHLYAYEDGTRINLSENGDGICTDFRSKEVLEKYYAKNVMIHWVDPEIVDGKPKANPNYDKNSDDVKKWAPYLTKDGKPAGWVVLTDKEGNPVTFDPADLDLDFVEQVKAFGIVGACMRENCPYHTKYDKANHTYDGVKAGAEGIKDFTAGYLAATDHEMDYEKFEEDGYGYPNESRVEKNEDGTKIRYNQNELEEYMVADSAKYFAEGVGGTGTNYERWTAIASKAGLDKKATARSDEEKKNYAILEGAAQAAMDADLHNLYTLQWIWNTLFVPADWLNPTKVEGNETVPDTELAKTRQAMYPTIEIKDETGKVLTTIDEQIARLTTLFQEANVSLLWKTNTKGEYISRWRPLTDNFEASCWVSLRCKWYRTKGNKCSRIDQEVNHDWPAVGEFDYDTHIANCQHVDLCNCCGKPIGKKGAHKLIPVAPTVAEGNLLNSPSMRAAWLEVLKHYKDIDWLKDILWVDEEANLTVNNWATCWRILEDTCYEGETVEGVDNVGKEDGHAIYICSGELEVIYNEIVNAAEQDAKTWEEVVGEGLDVEWKAASKKDATDGNYFVETVTNNSKHNYVKRYYSLGVFIMDGVEYKKDQLLAADEAEWNEKFAFSELVCNGGYYTLEVCSRIRRETDHVADGEGACKPGCEHECGKVKYNSRVDHEPAGHTLAPVENYWESTQRYTPATADHNAIMVQVCVICGEGFQSREYGVTHGGDDHEQFNLATQQMIDRWNTYVDAYNKKVDETLKPGDDPIYLSRAQLPRTEDFADKNGKGSADVAADGTIFGEGVTAFKGGKEAKNPEITLKGTGWAKGNSTVVLGENVTLSFKDGGEDTTDAKFSIDQGASVAFVGEDPASSTVDFSDLDGLTIGRNTELTFENITVVLSDEDSTGDRLFLQRENINITFKNAIVKSKTSPVTMNASSMLHRSGKITIDHSTFITQDVGIAVWDPAFSVEANDSIFFGTNAGAFIRSGVAHFTNCKFYTKADKHGTWGQAASTGVSAAIVIGNPVEKEARDYGNAKVELANCDFGLCEASYVEGLGAGVMATAEPEACNATNPAIAAFSSALNETEVKLDTATVLNAGEIQTTPGYKTVGEEQVSTLTLDYPDPTKEDLGKNATEQAQNAAKLVESLVGAGDADINLPKIDKEIEMSNFVVAEGTTANIALNNNTVKFKGTEYSNNIDGELTLTGGTLNVERSTADDVASVAVEGKLTLDNVTFVANGSILPCNGGTLVIKDSFIRSNKSMAITTNNTLAEPDVHITIENSTIASMDQSNGVDVGNEGNVGLLINNPNVTLTATNSTFYGVRTGAWVRGGDATFTGCTFISGSAMIGGTWGDGNKYPDNAAAALLIGNGGASTSYGNAKVTLTNCTGLVSKEVVKKGADDKYVPDTGNKVTVNDSAAMNAKIKADAVTVGAGTAKTIVLAAYKTCTVSLTMDEASAKAFFGANEDGTVKNPVVGTDLLLGESATNASFTIKYTTGTGEEAVEHELLPATVLAAGEQLSTKAGEALTEAAANGGKVVLPEAAEAPVEVSDKVFQVGEDKALELDLNGSELKLTGDGTYSAILASAGGEVTINGGTLDVTDKGGKAPIGANGEGSKLTIKNTTLKTNVSLQGENGATVVLDHTTIISSSPMAISTNNTLQPVHYTITNCKIASYAIGNVALLINGDQVTLEASDTEFYGTCTGVWVRAAKKATFTRCTFITGSAVTANESWGEGTLNPATAKAALLIGDGKGTYGNVVDVTIGEGCQAVISYEWYANRSSTSHNDEAITSVETDKITDKDGWFEFAPYDGTAKNKLFVIAEAGTQTANVKFASADVAKSFGIEGAASLVKDTNVYLNGSASISVTIGDAAAIEMKAGE